MLSFRHSFHIRQWKNVHIQFLKPQTLRVVIVSPISVYYNREYNGFQPLILCIFLYRINFYKNKELKLLKLFGTFGTNVLFRFLQPHCKVSPNNKKSIWNNHTLSAVIIIVNIPIKLLNNQIPNYHSIISCLNPW